MISTLHIQNIGIIEDITVEFDEGLNILTGETGAGKTLIIDALNIVTGNRFSREMIKTGKEYCLVEVCFFVPDNALSQDGNIIITRQIYSNGRNICKINGNLATLQEIKNLSLHLINIHGQHDNQSILDIKTHISLLDKFAGEELEKIKREYKEEYLKYKEISKKLKDNYGDEEEKKKTLDLYLYEKDEIEKADLKIGEEGTLATKRKLIMNKELVIKSLNESLNQIENVTLLGLDTANSSLEKISDLEERFMNIYQRSKSSYYELQDIFYELSSMLTKEEIDESEQQKIEERLDLIYNLKRKYGGSIEEILEYRLKLEEKINYIQNLEEYIDQLKEEKQKIFNNLSKLANALHQIREKTGKVLSSEVNRNLFDLEMSRANMTIKVEFDESNNFNDEGLDSVEFMISTNLGETEKPLAKISSGGEMARIMLSIKTVLADIDQIPSLIFDEIDTGVSGVVAGAIGEKLKYISKNHQVLCITHLANIAAKGNANYYINKQEINGNTVTNIKRLNEQEIIEELARIMSGKNITKSALQHAKELRM